VDNWYLWAVDRHFAPAYTMPWTPAIDPSIVQGAPR
jgi:hypothetical protein